MKALIKVSGEKIFRSESAIKLYNEMSKRTHISEFGKDTNGDIYFHWLNGNTDRYTRSEFLKMANNHE